MAGLVPAIHENTAHFRKPLTTRLNIVAARERRSGAPWMAGSRPRLSGTGNACLSARHCFYSGPEFDDSSGHERTKAVRHRNSVFHDLLKLVPWAAFDRLVDEHGTDQGTRSFTSRRHLNALLFAQLSGAGSLRGIEAAMASHQGRLYHSGAVAPKRSTFADANRNRDFRIFSGLFEAMLAQSGRGLRRKMADAVRLIDSTGLRLAGVGAQWARFSTGVFGAKAHVVYDPALGRPVYHAVTAANVNDITAAEDMPIEAGATYVFDLGYYDFAWWARLDALGSRLVTRRKNPMQNAVREIVVRTETGKTLRLLTNDLDASADEIADLYKRRWRIELFFRVMKQTLRITAFVGRSENAVRIQIAVALIAYLLLRALEKISKEQRGFLELVRLVRANLMHRKELTRLRTPPPPSKCDSRQLQLSLATT